jgi:hypothetical protein
VLRATTRLGQRTSCPKRARTACWVTVRTRLAYAALPFPWERRWL